MRRRTDGERVGTAPAAPTEPRRGRRLRRRAGADGAPAARPARGRRRLRRLRRRTRPPEPGARDAARAAVVAQARARTARLLLPAGLLALVVVAPVLVPSDARADQLSLAALFACVGVSLRILVGYLGQVSLGHQGFVGLGALAGALVTSHDATGLPFVLGLAAAGAVGAAAAGVVGYPAARRGGPALALATLALGLVVERSLFGLDVVTQGVPAGRPGGFEDARAYAYLCLVVLAAFVAVDWRLGRTKGGRALRTIAVDERLASSFGIDPIAGRLLALVTSGAMAAVAGALLGPLLGGVGPGAADLVLGLTFVAMVVIGGAGHRVGVLLSAASFGALTAEAGPLLRPAGGPGIGRALLAGAAAALLLLVLTRYPAGLGGLLHPVERWLGGEPLRGARRTAGRRGGRTGAAARGGRRGGDG